jgi:predicted RNA binding protein YcfA (HicA-like mRNA interferase family)
MEYAKLLSLLKSAEFELVRHKKHFIYSNGKVSVSIPSSKHNTLNKFTAKKILKDAGIEQ